jgi:HAD superfamily hydrolase (TIGR01549 family)
MIEALLFNFGQTLVDSADGFRSAEKISETRIFSEIGLESWSEFLTEYRRLRKDYHAQSNFSRAALWCDVYSQFGRKPEMESLIEMEKQYWEEVESKTKPFPEAFMVLEQLSSTYRLGMITNTQGQRSTSKHRKSLFPELEGLFEVIVVAGEDGIPPKPDPEPFLLCINRMGITPADAIYVGDDWRMDICGAADVGIQPIWIKHHSISRSWPKVETQVPVITSLEQLLDLSF